MEGAEVAMMEMNAETTWKVMENLLKYGKYNIVTRNAMENAVRLLKQDAVEPILKREGRNKNYNDYCCPICDNEVVYEQNFCSECGRPFLWEGR